MAAKLATGADGDDLVETHEINVTPFIDVILVLLIIFMVAAPLSTVDVNVDLPAASAKPVPRPDKPIFVTLKADKQLALGDDPITAAGLGAALDSATNDDKSKTIFVRADKTVPYDDFMGLMNTLRNAGYLKIGLVGLDSGKNDAPGAPTPSAADAPKP
ncbi:MAG: TonB system transport protein ExbD [Caulobacteraceae bacterium]|nr:TonB system transport protein ExbD [Caulobacter sp.]